MRKKKLSLHSRIKNFLIFNMEKLRAEWNCDSIGRTGGLFATRVGRLDVDCQTFLSNQTSSLFTPKNFLLKSEETNMRSHRCVPPTPEPSSHLWSPASRCQSSRSESTIPDQGEHPERPSSRSQQQPVPIVVCLSLRQCSHASSYVLLKFHFVSASFKSLWTCGSHLSSTSSALQLEVCGSPLFFLAFFLSFASSSFFSGRNFKVEEMWVTSLLLGGIIMKPVCALSPWRPFEMSGDPTKLESLLF